MRCQFQIQTGFYLFWAAAMVIVPIPWLLAWVCAVLIHELSHYIALKSFGIHVFRICVGMNGVIMETEEICDLKMFLCAMAGPIGGASLMVLLHLAPRIALCSMLLSAYNLLPIYPLDGGRAIRGLVQRFFTPNTAQRIVRIIEYSAIIVVTGVCIYVCVNFQLGLLPVICAVWLILRNKKFLANIRNKRYNIRNRSIRGKKYDSKASTNFANSSKACPLYRR